MVDKVVSVAGETEESLAPLPVVKSSLLRFLPEVVQQLAAKGGVFTINSAGTCIVEGFYRNGPMDLIVRDDGSLTAVDKRGRVKKIENFDDLLSLNYSWWRAACSKKNYVAPERPWLDGFLEKGWVGRQTIYTPKDGVAPSVGNSEDLEG